MNSISSGMCPKSNEKSIKRALTLCYIDIFKAQTKRCAEWEIGIEEFMRERGRSDSSYYHGAGRRRTLPERICFPFNG
jgi:hypothetical protein